MIPGEKVPVHFEINVPEEVQIGERYTVKIEFSVGMESEGGFGFGTGVEKSFNVTIGEKIIPPVVEKESNNSLYIILGLILAIILIIFFIKKRKK